MSIENPLNNLDSNLWIKKDWWNTPEYHPNNQVFNKWDEAQNLDGMEADNLLNENAQLFDNWNNGIGEIWSLGSPLNADWNGENDVLYAGVGDIFSGDALKAMGHSLNAAGAVMARAPLGEPLVRLGNYVNRKEKEREERKRKEEEKRRKEEEKRRREEQRRERESKTSGRWYSH